MPHPVSFEDVAVAYPFFVTKFLARTRLARVDGKRQSEGADDDEGEKSLTHG